MLGAGDLIIRFDCDSISETIGSGRHLSGITELFGSRLNLSAAALCQVFIVARFVYSLSKDQIPVSLSHAMDALIWVSVRHWWVGVGDELAWVQRRISGGEPGEGALLPNYFGEGHVDEN